MAESLSQSQLDELRKAFNLFDKDGSGSITADELRVVFQQLEIQASENQINAAIRQMDKDGDGEIQFEEFVKFMAPQFYRDYSPDEMKAVFRHFDRTGDGFITVGELKVVLSKIGKSFSDEQLSGMLKGADLDNNGKISIDEFVELMQNKE